MKKKDTLKLSLEDTMIVRDKAQELVRILEKIFTERCNVPMLVKTSYRPVEKKNTEPEIIYMKAAGGRREWRGRRKRRGCRSSRCQ